MVKLHIGDFCPLGQQKKNKKKEASFGQKRTLLLTSQCWTKYQYFPSSIFQFSKGSINKQVLTKIRQNKWIYFLNSL